MKNFVKILKGMIVAAIIFNATIALNIGNSSDLTLLALGAGGTGTGNSSCDQFVSSNFRSDYCGYGNGQEWTEFVFDYFCEGNNGDYCLKGFCIIVYYCDNSTYTIDSRYDSTCN